MISKALYKYKLNINVNITQVNKLMTILFNCIILWVVPPYLNINDRDKSIEYHASEL